MKKVESVDLVHFFNKYRYTNRMHEVWHFHVEAIAHTDWHIKKKKKKKVHLVQFRP